MKRTKKFIAGVQVLGIGMEKSKYLDNAELYERLEKRGYWWDSKSGKWTNRKQPSNSIFKTDDDVASGVIRLRVMAHPDDVETAVKQAKKTPGMRVIDISEPYPNRKGAGVRVYLTAVLDGHK